METAAIERPSLAMNPGRQNWRRPIRGNELLEAEGCQQGNPSYGAIG